MSRIRSIHPGLWTDEAFIQLSAEAQVLLIGLWTEADDQGVFEWKPLTLKLRLRGASNTAVEPMLAEMVALDCIRQFSAENKAYGAIRNFCRWQRPKQPNLLYPCPEEIASYVSVRPPEEPGTAPERGIALGRMLCEQQDGLCYYCSTSITFYRKRTNSLEVDHRTPISRGGLDMIDNLVAACRACNSAKGAKTEAEFRKRDDCELQLSHDAKEPSQCENQLSHPPFPLRGEIAKQMEEEGEGGREGGRKKERPLASLAPSADAERDRDFEAFWKAYPRKVGKGQARRAYSAACRKTAPVAILDAVSHTAFNPDPRFQPHPATWLNGERWLDDTSQFDPVLRAAGLRPEDFEDQRSAFAGLLQ